MSVEDFEGMIRRLHPAVWQGQVYSDGIPVSAAVAKLKDGSQAVAFYQAFRMDHRIHGGGDEYAPLCPPCGREKAYSKAQSVLLGDQKVIDDPRTLYALATVLIGLLNHSKNTGMFRMPITENAP